MGKAWSGFVWISDLARLWGFRFEKDVRVGRVPTRWLSLFSLSPVRRQACLVSSSMCLSFFSWPCSSSTWIRGLCKLAGPWAKCGESLWGVIWQSTSPSPQCMMQWMLRITYPEGQSKYKKVKMVLCSVCSEHLSCAVLFLLWVLKRGGSQWNE